MSYSVKNFLLEKRELDKENQCRAGFVVCRVGIAHQKKDKKPAGD